MWSKLLYNQLWNIGFCRLTTSDFIASQTLPSIKWLNHSYKDRWFADPFIYKITEGEIVVFVEELPIENPKGIICELVIDRKTMRLKERYVMLELDTHLSYPAIIEENGRTYVYPENGQSGKLNLYEYDAVNHKLINPVCIVDEPLADSTIFRMGDYYYLCATKYPDTQEKVYLYKSNSLKGVYLPCSESPFNINKGCSRPAGDWILSNNELYRPAQDCIKRYGHSISMMSVDIKDNTVSENIMFSVIPVSWRYNLGIHTINFKDGFCVVDSFGYLHPVIARIIFFLINIKHKVGL
ncbi:MAG: hypothetical protein J6W75_00435 [Bacteroidaceae bacterium]|nr:hypothetical protein [Bacteroidaceae bacterium]